MSILRESLSDSIRHDRSLGVLTNESDVPKGGMSYLQGETTQPLSYITIPQLLRETVARFGPRDAVIFGQSKKRYSYYDLDRDVDALASGFLALGLDKGDRVGIWAPNRYEWVLTQFASARVGLVMVNINPAYRLSEVEYVLKKVRCKSLILANKFKSSNYIEMIQQLVPELESCDPSQLNSAKFPVLKSVIAMDDNSVNGIYDFTEIMGLGGPGQQLRLPIIDETLNPDDAINIQFTSGTTGSPKGATLSHFNIVNNAKFVTDRIKLTEADRLCIPVPLYHCFGMVMGVLGAVSKGAAMAFPSEGFDPKATLEMIAKERCTALYGVPTMFVALLAELEVQSYETNSLRTGIMAGAPCPIDVMEKVNTVMNMSEVTICYGMTETSPVSFQSYVDDTTDKRCTTVGRIHPHLEVKIIDEGGQIVPVGKKGELCTRGYSVMKGYWEDSDKTNVSIVDGWMLTGDLATIDGQGFCSIVGRVKDMIIRGGENVYPREVEEYLYRNEKIKEAQVFGVPDEKLGEEVCAWIVPKDGEQLTEDDVGSFLQGQVAHYKIPKYIRIVEVIPMTITGKPQKFVMRDQMVEEFKLLVK